MYRDYRDKDVNFYYVYANMQHPEINNYVAPHNLKEKLMLIAEFRKLSQSEMPWLADNMHLDLKQMLGAAPNGEYVFDKKGKLVGKRFWSDPNGLRKDLEKLVGKVDKVTRVEDLKTRFKVEPRKIASGIVKPVKMPGGTTAIVVKPQPDEMRKTPFYVKLRAEVSTKILPRSNGRHRPTSGKLFLGFYLDPIYKVHWNNKMSPIVIKIKQDDQVVLDQYELMGPKLKEPADIDPRQFLLTIKTKKETDFSQPLEITVSYTACDDAGTFCFPVKQKFVVRLKRDDFGGTRPGVFMPQVFADIKKFDRNKDGFVTRDELPQGQASLYIGSVDRNNDGKIDEMEIREFHKMFNNGRGFESDKNFGG